MEGRVSELAGAVPRARAVPAAALLGGLVAASAVVRLFGALEVPTPWITPDETLYGLLGRSLWEDGTLGLLGGETGYYSVVYPLLVGLPLALGDLELGYALAKALQALVMSAAAIPVYLWGRQLMRPGLALAAAALTLAVPGLAYTGLLMTEVAFYPAMALAAWAAARALESPTRARQGLLLGAVFLTLAIRLQAVVLLPALLTAAVATRTTRRLWPTWAALGGIGLVWTAARVAAGATPLGGYQVTTASSYELVPALRFVLYHAGDLVWMTGVVPACALVLLVLRPPADRGGRALVAVSVSLAAWLVVEVGVFASAHVGQLAERDLLAAGPPLFLALCLWLDRGAPRPRLATSVAALGVVSLVAATPFSELLTPAAFPDAFTLASLERLDVDPTLAATTIAAAAGAAFVLLPARLLPLLPVLLVVLLATASAAATERVGDHSRAMEENLVGADPRWIDRLADGPAAYLYDGEANWPAVWVHAFWNRSVEHVYDLPGTEVSGPMPQATVRVENDGRVVARGGALPERNVVVSSFVELVGRRLGEAVQHGTGQRALVLWRIEPPLRISSRITGVQANGDVVSGARLTAFACVDGSFAVTYIAKGAQQLEISRDGSVVRRLALEDGATGTEFVPAAPAAPGGICTFDVASTGLLGTTRLEFLRG